MSIREQLGWSELCEALSKRAHSALGAQAASRTVPLTDRSLADKRSREVAAARTLRERAVALPFGSIHDVEAALSRAARGARLEPSELIAIGETGRSCDRLRLHIRDYAEHAEALVTFTDGMVSLGHLVDPILGSFDADGALVDSASPALARLRRQVAQLRRNLETKMQEMTSRQSIAKHLQDAYFTIRDDRYVVPVKVSSKGDIRGIVHGTSQSGQTVFVEPEPIVEQSNRLRLAECDARDEERRILSELSASVAACLPDLEAAIALATELDVIDASARLADDMRAWPARIDDAAGLQLKQLRHPLLLLGKGACVASDVELAPESTLIISGPNAGGKTVSLKAVGLAALMARAGLHIAADEDSRIPWFDRVFGDIGDSQSIERDLSTFSAHLLTLKQMLAEARTSTLVLVDEIGVGTEPEQGAALAVAIVEAFAKQRVTAIVTTHYEPLKLLAVEHPQCANAAVGFDTETMTPTFELKLGVSGSSGALDIAKRMGLPCATIDRARELLGEERMSVQQLALELEGERRAISREREQLRAAQSRAEAAQRLADAERERLRNQREQLHERAHSDAVEALQKARREIDAARAQIRKAGTKRKLVGVTRELDSASAAVSEHAPVKPQVGEAPDPALLSAGVRVTVHGIGTGAVVADAQRGRVEVQIGGLRTVVGIDLVRLAGNAPKPSSPKKPRRATRSASTVSLASADVAEVRTVDATLDLRGERVDDAIALLERFLDRSVLSERSAVWVIHGHGTGALRRGVREALKASPVVAKLRPGSQHEGGDGVTVATLR